MKTPNTTWVELKDFDFSAGNDIQQLNPRDPSLVDEVSKSFEAVNYAGSSKPGSSNWRTIFNVLMG